MDTLWFTFDSRHDVGYVDNAYSSNRPVGAISIRYSVVPVVLTRTADSIVRQCPRARLAIGMPWAGQHRCTA